jgi:hypothetical protein
VERAGDVRRHFKDLITSVLLFHESFVSSFTHYQYKEVRTTEQRNNGGGVRLLSLG